MRTTLCLLTLTGLLLACKSYRAADYDFPNPVDTSERPIEFQERKIFAFEEAGIFADNRFDGARLNALEWIGDSLLQARINPENQPINPSAYYAFKLWSRGKRKLILELTYGDGFHRYWPKISHNGSQWRLLDSTDVVMAADSSSARLQLELNPDTLWVAAQEIRNSSHVRDWCARQGLHPAVEFGVIDTSRLGRDLFCLDINEGDPKEKDVIVILSRQHPPEVTGYLAMEVFVNEILDSNPLSDAFRKKFHLLVFPLMNPDGVDLGHWRHNAGGIDLNRDWAYYRQPETRKVADHVVKVQKKNKCRVILGLDFHSTWYDVYYTPDSTVVSHIHGFKDLWLSSIRREIPGYEPYDAPGGVGGPVSAGWFFTQFGAEGITYEIGDNTPRDFIREKGEVSAREMMKILLQWK